MTNINDIKSDDDALAYNACVVFERALQMNHPLAKCTPEEIVSAVQKVMATGSPTSFGGIEGYVHATYRTLNKDHTN